MNEHDVEIVVDDRERRSGLPEAVAARWPGVRVGRLALGDIEIGPRILIERKTVRDFVASLVDGRLYRQAYALNGACVRPLLIVEGEDAVDVLGLSPDSFRGTLLTLAVGYRLPMLRTGCVRETAEFVAHLAWQESRRLARRASDAPGPTPARIAAEMLGAIPGIGDLRARRLVTRFGSLASVLSADVGDLTSVPGIGPDTARAIRDVGHRPDGADRVSESVGSAQPPAMTYCAAQPRELAHAPSRLAGDVEGRSVRARPARELGMSAPPCPGKAARCEPRARRGAVDAPRDGS